MNINTMETNTLIEIFNAMAEEFQYSEKLYTNREFIDHLDDNYTISEFWEMISPKEFDLRAPYFLFEDYEITSFDDDFALKEHISRYYGEELFDYLEGED